ncbi:hypothetical protein Ade02nite_83520 [Paractinoplanes deccanensis]|uniref:Lipoprotein n=1 Tax=Paractinoplanes deccanensis TaxID=113561 RepID=A0ABQ3YI81_9ACTN|nr:hypothetical protein [Actinoplanes deccanensis]GID79711.1 hypothetical protein Ade02nite_83520 [Actinoplanes deccanensis]
MTRTPLRIPRSAAAGIVAVLLGGSLTGCSSLTELTSSSKPLLGGASTPSPAVSASPSPSASASPAVTRASGPLDTGTVTHRIDQGNFSVQLTYWTSDNAKLYTASSVKTINVAAHVEDADSTHRVTVTTFQVTQDDGTKRGVVSTDSGKFDVTPPYPYNTVVTLPAATAGAPKLTLTIRLDLLVETAPKSNSYYRSTALDTLTLPLLTNGAAR